MTDTNLRKIVAAVLDTSATTDPAHLAQEIAQKVPARSVRACLAESLAPYVREQIHHRRMHNPILADTQRKQSARSSKVAAIRDGWAAALRDLFLAEDGWKPLGEFTFEDLVFAANDRRKKAQENLAKADRFDALAERLRAAGVDTVAELPPTEFDAIEAVAA